MMKAMKLFIILIALLTIFSCNPVTNSTSTPKVTHSTISDGEIFWDECYGRFNTNNIERAQAEIPFKLILPSYLPDERQIFVLPNIEGPLRESNTSDEVEVFIRYRLNLGTVIRGLIVINESNIQTSLGDPELNPQIEEIVINDITIRKTKDNLSSQYFSLYSDGVYYSIEMNDIPSEEALKIVQSIVEQLK